MKSAFVQRSWQRMKRAAGEGGGLEGIDSVCCRCRRSTVAAAAAVSVVARSRKYGCRSHCYADRFPFHSMAEIGARGFCDSLPVAAAVFSRLSSLTGAKQGKGERRRKLRSPRLI